MSSSSWEGEQCQHGSRGRRGWGAFTCSLSRRGVPGIDEEPVPELVRVRGGVKMRRPNLSKRPGGDNSLPSAEEPFEAGADETAAPLPSSALLAVTRALAAPWSYCGVSGTPEVAATKAGAPVEM